MAVALSILAAASYFYLVAGDETIDKTTLCPADGPKGHVVLLVDKTDALNFTQSHGFVAYLSKILNQEVKPGELFSVFVLGEDYTSTPTPLFEMCNPGTGEGKSAWTSNPAKLRRQYEDKFLKPVEQLADQLKAITPAATSPIMEMLQMVSIHGFQTKQIEGRKRLFIVSDMLQNSPVLSQYSDRIAFDVFAKRPDYQKIKTRLDGTEVELAFLMNSPTLQTRGHLLFWEQYFDALGARLVSVRTIEG